MKIAVLADIHGNHYALQEVLKSAEKQNVEHLLILGDITGYYYYPDGILDILSNWKYDMIQGNHEGFIGSILKKEIELESINAKYGKGLQIAFEKLSADTLAYLAALPHQLSLKFDDVNINICHGSPWDRDQYIYPDASGEMIKRCSKPNAHFVLMGHTHYPCCFKDENSFIANAGSVGQSRTSGGVANWAIINTANKSYVAQSTQYDTTSLIKDVMRIDPQLPYLVDVLTR